MNLDSLLEDPRIWRGGRLPEAAGGGIPTGFPALDRRLGGGWPEGALSELLAGDDGSAALGLVLPALARLSRGRRWLAWVAPPHIPYAPGLAAAGVDLSRVLVVHARKNRDSLWALEQALRSGSCAAVLGWPWGADPRMLRRLQLAAEAGATWGILFRPEREADRPSPAALRLRLESAGGRLRLRILKRRGGGDPGLLDLDH